MREEIDELKSEINTLKCSSVSNNNYVIFNDNIEIDCMAICANFCVDVCNNISISGSYSSKCIKIRDLKGIVAIDKCNISDFKHVYGTLTIYNCENGTIFLGTIFVANNQIRYVISNRPLIQIGIPFDGIINIHIKMVK